MISKKLLVMPGTLWQTHLIKKIKELGYKAYVIHPSENSPCFQYADGYLQEDIFNHEKIIEFCKREHIDAVISDECDIAMPLIAYYCKLLGVNTIDTATASLYTNKYEMREFCKCHGLNTPEYKLCKTIQDVISFLDEIRSPIIIKPLDSNASHGIFKITTADEIKEKFDETMSFSRREKAILAERYIEEIEFTIDGIKTPSTHYTLAISEKKHYNHNINIAKELYFSHTNPSFDYEKLKKANDKFIELSHLHCGLTHAEYKFENGKFYLIEIAARGGGNMISSVISPYMSGHDTYQYLIDCYTTGAYDTDFSISNSNSGRVAILKFFDVPSGGGFVKSINGLDVLENTDGIVFYKLNFEIGDTIKDALNDSTRIGFYIACAESEIELRNIIANVEKNFIITIENT